MWVVVLTAVTMVIEIIFGISTRSMALLADGIHMGSHVLAIGLSWVAYIIVRKVSQNEKFTGNSDKILSLSGYSSGLLLLIFAIVIIVEAVQRFKNPSNDTAMMLEFGEDVVAHYGWGYLCLLACEVC